MPSAASRLPKTLPTKREYCDQFIPKANSCTTPVATPIAKMRPYTLTQKNEDSRHTSSWVRKYFQLVLQMIRPSPIDSGGKMKWKLAVRANCRRDRNSGFTPKSSDGPAPQP